MCVFLRPAANAKNVSQGHGVRSAVNVCECLIYLNLSQGHGISAAVNVFDSCDIDRSVDVLSSQVIGSCNGATCI